MLNIAYKHASVVLVIFHYYMLQNKQSNTGCPKKNYTLFDLIERKTYKSYFDKTKSIPFTDD